MFCHGKPCLHWRVCAGTLKYVVVWLLPFISSISFVIGKPCRWDCINKLCCLDTYFGWEADVVSSFDVAKRKVKNCFGTILKLWITFWSSGKPYIQNEDTERCSRTQWMKNVQECFNEECGYWIGITHWGKGWLLPLVTALVQSEVVRPLRRMCCRQGFAGMSWQQYSRCFPGALLLHVSGARHTHRRYRQELGLLNTLITGDIS